MKKNDFLKSIHILWPNQVKYYKSRGNRILGKRILHKHLQVKKTEMIFEDSGGGNSSQHQILGSTKTGPITSANSTYFPQTRQTEDNNPNKRPLSNNLTPEKTETKREKNESIPPIVFFQIDTYFNNYNLLTEDFNGYFNEDILAELKITANCNLLVFPGTADSKERILDCSYAFPNSKRLDISSKPENPTLIVKGINEKKLSLHAEELKGKGVTQAIEIKKPSGEQMKLTKIILNSNETKKDLTRGVLVIDGERFYVEEPAKPPSRCSKSKRLGHTITSCQNKSA
ncbi:hypothetical protein BpHYR1_043344 [Brachionus plicatilis]|uniref:Uncharacterized protein n=1 Tax=Brachionus plicatilis TaxID=10195 RepID=A0A3M7QAX5_BRAPC|nr:hypothetical protein BpHYR1_043344 [Brachionus plicatilis]